MSIGISTINIKKYSGGDVITYDENFNLVYKSVKKVQQISTRIKIRNFSPSFDIIPSQKKTEDSSDKDEHFPELTLSKTIVLKKKDIRRKSYRLDDVALEFMNNNVREISQISEGSVEKWGAADLKERIRKRDEAMKISEEKRKEDARIAEEKRKEEEKELMIRLKKEEEETSIILKKKSMLGTTLNDHEQEVLRLQEEIALMRRKINKNVKKSGPWIVKNDPTINYDEPKYIETIPGSVWVYNTCGCGSMSMHAPHNYDPSAQLELDAAYSKYSAGGPSSPTIYTNVYDPYNGGTKKTSHVINFISMTYTVAGGYPNCIAKQPGKGIQTPNPKYKGPRPIHEMFQMRSYDDQFEPGFKRTSLNPSSAEYKMVENNFLTDTCGGYQTTKSAGVRVLDVIKVVNPVSARFYELMKEVVDDKTEVMVYHGTRSTNIETVAKEGLDTRVGAGGYYGRAIYGSDSAFYSYNGYGYSLSGTDREGMLFYAKFLVGKVKETPYYEQNLTKNPQGFDSVRSTTVGEEGIRTVYDNARCYIEYMVHYTTRPSDFGRNTSSTW
ncbi:MAG: hypothetical protein PHG66_05565 [Candidatus Colwellbacteria bacterium]|nr:hypothetical protein [Candidatus Colwellbacteria bacterium]